MSASSEKGDDPARPLTDRQVLLHALKVVASIIHIDGVAPSIPEAMRRLPDLVCLSDGDRQAVISKAESMLQN